MVVLSCAYYSTFSNLFPTKKVDRQFIFHRPAQARQENVKDQNLDVSPSVTLEWLRAHPPVFLH